MRPLDLAKPTALLISNEEIDDVMKINQENKKVDFLAFY